MNYNFQREAIFMGFVPVLSWLLCWGFLVLPKICYQHCSIPGIKCYISAMICCGNTPAPPYFFLLFLFFLVALLLTGVHWLSYKGCPGHVPGVCYWGLGVLEKPEIPSVVLNLGCRLGMVVRRGHVQDGSYRQQKGSVSDGT